MSSFIVQLLNSSRTVFSKQWCSSIALKRWSPRGRIPQDDSFDEMSDDIEEREEFTPKHTENKRSVNVDYAMDDFDEGMRSFQEIQRKKELNNSEKRRYTGNDHRGKFDGYGNNQRLNYNRDEFESKFYDSKSYGRNQSQNKFQNRDVNYDSRNHGNSVRRDFGNDSDYKRRGGYENRYSRTDFDNRNHRSRENYNEGYGPPENRFQRDNRYRQRNDFDNRNHRSHENYNEGYGPPENRFQRDDRYRQGNDFRPKSGFNPSRHNEREPYERFRGQQNEEDPFDKLFNKASLGTERLLLPNPYNVTEENKVEILNELIAPWHKYSYDSQLSMIHNDAGVCLRNLGKKLVNVNSEFRLTEKGLPCYLDPPIASPVTSVYRNRSEYSIGPGMDGNPKTVGFFLGTPSKHENVVCVSPDGSITTKESHAKFAKLFQDYLRNVSTLEVCLDFRDGKNWRNLIVRSNECGEHMLMAMLHPQQLKPEQLESEKELLRNYFEPLAEEHQIKSLYFQACPGSVCSHEQSPFQLVFGEPAIEETIGGVKYLIPPDSFFFLNKSGGEEVSKALLKSLELSPEEVVVDLYFGLGLLSLQTAPFVKKVIGFELSQMSLEYARKNAELNGFNNVAILNLKVEDGLAKYREELWDKDVVVIAKPPFDGFRSSILPKLRSMESVKRIVFVSPRPPTLNTKCCKNLFQLMLPERRSAGIEGAPFVAINAVPYSLVPHTAHYGLIVYLERQSRFTN